MQKFAFISSHKPTEKQIELARKKGIELFSVGDHNAFTITSEWIESHAEAEGIYHFDGVIVSHAGAFARLFQEYEIGIYETANHAPIDQAPRIEPVALHLYDL